MPGTVPAQADQEDDKGLFEGLLDGAKKLLFGHDSEPAATPASGPTGPSDLLGPTLQQNRSLTSSPIENAAASAAKELDGGGGLLGKLFGPGEKEAGRALAALHGLPPEQQGAAVAKLSSSQIQALVKNASIEDRERMLGLVENTKDPERKLELFGAYHKAHATLDAKRARDSDPSLTKEQRAERARVRGEAAAGTGAEVDDEMQFLRTKEGGFNATDVDELMRRKSTELNIEMKHAVKLTNQTGLRDGAHDGEDKASHPTAQSHVHWSQRELAQLDYDLDQAPKQHMSGISEIRRQSIDNSTPTAMASQNPNNARITVLDEAVRTEDLRFTSIGEPRERARDDNDAPIERLEHDFSHELGHHVHNTNAAAFAKYQEAGKWKSQPGPNGTETYTPAPGAIPGAEAATKRNPDPYQYARTSPKEGFAEHYAKATHAPETLHNDMVKNPHKQTEAARTSVESLEEERKKAVAAGRPVADIDAKLATAKTSLAQAESTETMRKKQFDIMRDDVFGTGEAQKESEARLEARGLDVNQMKAFREQAAEVSTPEQLARVEQSFMQPPPGRLPVPGPPAKPWPRKKKPKPPSPPPQSGSGGCADGP